MRKFDKVLDKFYLVIYYIFMIILVLLFLPLTIAVALEPNKRFVSKEVKLGYKVFMGIGWVLSAIWIIFLIWRGVVQIVGWLPQ